MIRRKQTAKLILLHRNLILQSDTKNMFGPHKALFFIGEISINPTDA